MLKDLGISEGDTLLGKITVIVEDSKCDLSISVQLYEFSTIRELKSAYAEATRRITSAASMINFHDRQNLGDDETLDGCGISDMEKVLFENPSYDIKIVDELEDGKIETHINVADHWTVSQVKEAFSRETRQALVAGDKLVFGGVNLEDTDMLFQHSVDHMSELLLVREDSSRAIVYECAECGSDVRLKRYEPIRCRSCGCRIVFKKRTTRRKFIYCNLFHS
jgi:DNA-directed RNA polymerase subunit RPC12/RpoP